MVSLSIRLPIKLASWAAFGLALANAPSADAQTPVPAGGEFQVNSYTFGFQGRPSVAAAADGDFVVVWQSYGSAGTDDSSNSIQGQRHASDGTPQGAQFQVNTYTTNIQDFTSVAAAADGDFFVVWDSTGSSGGDTYGRSIQGQRYASDGSAQGAQFQVNTYTTSAQKYPFVAADDDGDFVVVWQSIGSYGTDTSFDSIQGQRYASDGSPQGAQFQINTNTAGTQDRPSVAASPNGDFVVVWRIPGIQGRRYASDGSPQGAQFQVNTYTPTSGSLDRPKVASASDGDFVVVWGGSKPFMDPTGIQGQRYASDGSAQGAQFQVNTYTAGNQLFPAVAAADDGDFVVVWESRGSPGTDTSYYSTQGQRHASNGNADGDQFQVNTYTTNVQYRTAVAADADVNFVVVWHSSGSSGTDTSQASIQGQRYIEAPPFLPALSPEMSLALAGALMLLGISYALVRRV